MTEPGVIEVRIPRAQIGLCPSEIYLGSLMVNALRKAGVPVIGEVFPNGVERGSLTQFTCPETGGPVFIWRETR